MVMSTSAGPYMRAVDSVFCGWKPSLNSSLAQSAAEMSKGTYRLLTLQIFDTVLLFAGSVVCTFISGPHALWTAKYKLADHVEISSYS
jgi:hypothetical protein